MIIMEEKSYEKEMVDWIIICYLLFRIVKALEHSLNELIPVDELATVSTDRFQYNDFSFSSKIDEKGNGIISFGSIHNNMKTNAPISIHVLLFDQNKINIGFLAYCSDKDLETEYTGFKLQGDKSTTFYIQVLPKYFENGKSAKDVSYIAVMDENKYCREEKATLYVGKTIEQITHPGEEEIKMDGVIEFFNNIIHTMVFKIICMVLGIIVVLIGYGLFLNLLHRRMYTRNNYLVFFPVINIYITVQLVFGHILAIIFGLLCIGSGVLYYYLHIPYLIYVVVGLWIFSIIMVIIKLITKKYDLLYFEPAMNSSEYGDISNTKKKKTEEENDVSLLDREEDSLLDDEEVNHLSDINQPTGDYSTSIDHLIESLENPDKDDHDWD